MIEFNYGYHQHLFSCRIDSKCEESWLVSKLLSSGGASAYIGGNDIEHDGTFFWAGGHFSYIFVSTFIYTCLASHKWPQSHQKFQILCWSRGSFNLFSSCSRDPSFLLLACALCTIAYQLKSNFEICQKKQPRWGSEPQPPLDQLEEWPGSKSN